MAWCGTAVAILQTQWSYCSLAVGHRNNTVVTGLDMKQKLQHHDDVIKWKHFPRYWPFVRTKASDAKLFFDMRLNKRLSKQSCGWWFETLSRPLWRRRNAKKTFHISTSQVIPGVSVFEDLRNLPCYNGTATALYSFFTQNIAPILIWLEKV